MLRVGLGGAVILGFQGSVAAGKAVAAVQGAMGLTALGGNLRRAMEMRPQLQMSRFFLLPKSWLRKRPQVEVFLLQQNEREAIKLSQGDPLQEGNISIGAQQAAD